MKIILISASFILCASTFARQIRIDCRTTGHSENSLGGYLIHFIKNDSAPAGLTLYSVAGDHRMDEDLSYKEDDDSKPFQPYFYEGDNDALRVFKVAVGHHNNYIHLISDSIIFGGEKSSGVDPIWRWNGKVRLELSNQEPETLSVVCTDGNI